VQQELMPRVSAEIGLNRWLTSFTWIDNAAAPIDRKLQRDGAQRSRLPEEAQRRRPLQRQQNVASNIQEVTTLAGDYGELAEEPRHPVNVSARPRNGLVFQGSFSTGTVRTSYCETRTGAPEYGRAAIPSSTSRNPWCGLRVDHRYTGLGTYTCKDRGVGVGHVPATRRAAGGQPGLHAAQTTLGRPFANNAPNVTVNLIEPGTLYGDRVNEIDFRFAKILRFGRTRTNVGFDVYNITNSAPVLTYNQTFSPTSTTWLTPNSVLQPRFWKFSVQLDF
jgi:hypothetical protein